MLLLLLLTRLTSIATMSTQGARIVAIVNVSQTTTELRMGFICVFSNYQSNKFLPSFAFLDFTYIVGT